MLDFTRLRILVSVARHGSVTAAARALDYTQPSISHHLGRLEAETGTQLVQRVGRGIRLTDAGHLLAERGAEILGRVDAAESELAAQVGLRSGRVRLAAFPSALSTLVPHAAAALAAEHPDLDVGLTEAEPPAALHMLRAGQVDVAVIFSYGPADTGLRAVEVLTEPVHLVTPAAWARRPAELRAFAAERWIAGCERCRAHLLDQCRQAGFAPRIAFTTDDYVAVQSLVAAELGVTTLPALTLRAARNPGVRTTPLPHTERRILAATYGEPPDPPATAALVAALTAAAAPAPLD